MLRADRGGLLHFAAVRGSGRGGRDHDESRCTPLAIPIHAWLIPDFFD
jgi:hypothetical protein